MSPRSPTVRSYGDLGLVVLAVILVDAVLLWGGLEGPARWVLGVPFLTVLPGYALVSVLFPGSTERPVTVAGDRSLSGTGGENEAGPGWPVRIALAVAFSVVLVAVVGIVLSETTGIHLVSAVAGVSVVTIALSLLAAVRRQRLAPERSGNPLGGGPGVASVLFGRTGLQSAAMGVALIALLTAVVFAGAAPSDGESYSEFYVLTENEDGELVAGDYPSTFVAGEGHDLHVGIENEEGETVSYEVVVLAHADGSEPEEVSRFQTRLHDGESALVERSIAPTTTVGETRLEFLLFEGGAGSEPTAANADSSLQLWVDVVESE